MRVLVNSYFVSLLIYHNNFILKATPNSASNGHFLTKTSEEGVQLIKSLLELLESMVNLMSEDARQQETLTVYIHILATYLSSDNDKSTGLDLINNINNNKKQQLICDLNDLVLRKLISLGTKHKEDFKQVIQCLEILQEHIINLIF